MRTLPALCLVLASIASPALAATERLTLEKYLTQVSDGNGGVQAARESSEGADLRSEEFGISTSPQLFFQFQSASDAKPSPFFNYAKVLNRSYSFGFVQKTTIGLEGKVSYNYGYTNYIGLRPEFYEGRPAIELNQSLWRNGFGATTRAERDASNASALAAHYSKSYEARLRLIGAEQTYWRLALSRQAVVVSKGALERARKALEWSARRARLQLADESDELQSRSAVELRSLQLQAAEDDARAAARAFNSARGLTEDTVAEPVEEVSDERVAKLAPPQRAQRRDDVKAAEQGERLAVANAELGLSRDLPTVDLFGTMAFNSLQPHSSDAISKSFQDDRPTLAVGVRVSVPIDVPNTFRSRRGWHLEKDGAERAYQRQLFEQEREWADLTAHLADRKRRLELARSIESAQEKKFNYERARQQRGRSTVFQVLNFEEDYAQAQLGRIRAQAEVLQTAAQLKSFISREGDSE